MLVEPALQSTSKEAQPASAATPSQRSLTNEIRQRKYVNARKCSGTRPHKKGSKRTILHAGRYFLELQPSGFTQMECTGEVWWVRKRCRVGGERGGRRQNTPLGQPGDAGLALSLSVETYPAVLTARREPSLLLPEPRRVECRLPRASTAGPRLPCGRSPAPVTTMKRTQSAGVI